MPVNKCHHRHLCVLVLIVLLSSSAAHSQFLDTMRRERQPGNNTCEAYYDEPEQVCPVGEHCVGSCRYRFCATTLLAPLDQSACPKRTHESCAPHYSSRSPQLGAYQARVQCADGEHCSGTCNDRFCSSNATRLDQDLCDQDDDDDDANTCEAYRDAWGVERERAKCPPGFFCTGACNNRFCARTTFLKKKMQQQQSLLNQSACRSSPPPPPPPMTNETTYETCDGYFNALGLYQSPQQCPPGHVCGGECEMRVCTPTKRLDQTTCSDWHKRRDLPEPCYAYVNVESWASATKATVSRDDQVCLFGTTCCGTCDERFCCSNYRLKLDQTRCANDRQYHEKSKPDELAFCEAYYDRWGDYQPRHVCTQRAHRCSGKCTYRYCSPDEPALNQTECALLANSSGISSSGGGGGGSSSSLSSSLLSMFDWRAHTCDAYTDKWGEFSEREVCPVGEQCCGSCGNRYCCGDSFKKLDQASCDPSTPMTTTTTTTTTTISNNVAVAKEERKEEVDDDYDKEESSFADELLVIDDKETSHVLVFQK